jgi:hypothetical protein
MTTDQSSSERVKGVASTAADEGKHVGSVAKDEVQNVVGTAAEQARNVAGEAVSQVRDQLTEQTSGQRDRLVQTLQSFGDDLERMAGQASDGGVAADLVREVADRARSLKDHLDGREPGMLLEDVRGFARRRPGTFLLGALAAGVVAGRLFRGAADGAAAAELATPAPSSGVGVTDLDSGALPPPPPTTGSLSAPTTNVGPGAAPLTPSTVGQPTIETP